MKKKLFLAGMAALMCAIGLVVMGCESEALPSLTITGGGGTGGSTKETASTLTGNTWTSGASISSESEVDWYKFEAAGGQTYFLSWDESGGSGSYTCNITVSVFQSDGSTALNGILNADSGYSTPKTISGYTGTVYIKVQGYYSSSTGTYAIKYATDTSGTGGTGGGDGNNSMGTASTLTNNTWTSGTAISPKGDVDWYKFEANSLKTYNLTWDDGKAPNSGNYTGDVMVAVYQEDGSAMYTNYYDNGYASIYVRAYTGTVYIKVVGYASYVYPSSSFTSDKTGSYSIKYEQGDSNDRMGAATALVNGVWTRDTAIYPAGDIDWYQFDANNLKTYNLTWDDGKFPNSGTYSEDITVTAYRSDGSTVLNDINNADNGYASRIIRDYTGTVYIRVQSYSSSSTGGTYTIKYEQGDSNDSMGSATALVNDVWTSGTAISPKGDVDWYKFTADSLKTYNLTWDDGKAPNSGSYTGDVMVAAYREDGSAMTSSYWDNGYASVSISAYTGTVYIKVVGYESYVYPSSSFTSDKTGSYRIKYTEN